MHLAGIGSATRPRGKAFGSNPAEGRISFRYSAIASVSQIFVLSWVRQGTRKEGFILGRTSFSRNRAGCSSAPLSGHFATLLRAAVGTMLPERDVYITDWHNARDIALEHGRLGFDDYIIHLIRFLEVIGPGAHVVAVCQPCVAALVAATIMGARRQSGAAAVHDPYGGADRLVYPGFVQLAAFMSMNIDRHLKAHRELYENLANGETAKAAQTKAFYDIFRCA